jgi:glycosyltransferase involved in cell wall biosynthesis
MKSIDSQVPARRRPYRFGFVLNTTLGNLTRYENFKKYAERDQDIEFTWAPVSHYTPPDLPSRLRFLPAPLFMRARVIQQAWPALARLGQMDAVMIHLFEAELLCALRSCLFRQPVLISSTDEAPITDRRNYPLYPNDHKKSAWRQKLRLAVDRWRVRRMDGFVPFSSFVADILVRDCDVRRDRVHPLHVGMDFELWKSEPKAEPAADQRLQILFVGGDFVRKGGMTLLEVFRSRFQNVADLHLVTKQAPKALPAHVQVHDDFLPNDPRLTRLYASSDVLVVPTTADLGPLWVFLEAMAMRLPVIATDVGAAAEVSRHGETGLLVKVDDAESLGAAIQTLLENPALRRQMGERGRELVELKFNASINVPKILALMKGAVMQATQR